MGADGEAEAEAVTGRHQGRIDLDVGAEMIGRHQLQRLAADDPVAVERAAVEQHLAEPRIIHRGRNQTAAAGFHHWLLEHVEELHLVAGPGIGREGFGETVRIFSAGVKPGLGHLQWCENAFG